MISTAISSPCTAVAEPMSDFQEQDALVRAVAGDQDALTALLENSGGRLRQHLCNQIDALWQSVFDVDDVLQVTFLEVFLRISSFAYRGPGSFDAWLTRIAKNNLIDAVRALERAKQLPAAKRLTIDKEADSALALWNELGFTTGTPSRQAVARELDARVRDAVAQLPRDYAQVLTLYDLDGQDAQQVADTMQRSKGAIYMLRARALDLLRERLGSESQL